MRVVENLNLQNFIQELLFDDEGISTITSLDQEEVEDSVIPLLEPGWLKEHAETLEQTRLDRDNHVHFISKALHGLPGGYVSLDASKPWIMYWTLHALDLLGVELSLELRQRALQTLRNCLNEEDGGFGGGKGQISHLATTYAAVNSIAILEMNEGYELLNPEKILKFFLSLKQPDGSFTMHNHGEIDVRGIYCVVSVAKMLGILTPELTKGMAEFIAKCQTYQGGLCGFPGSEAHGGYAFCALAALDILGQVYKLRIHDFSVWVLSRQMKLEGGFNGRTNKLVDGCYSFWMGAIFPILQKHLPHLNYDQEALQKYLLLCCQTPKGGLRDKPVKYPDLYHTCYCLSGLSIAQCVYEGTNKMEAYKVIQRMIFGDKSNELNRDL